MGEHKLFDKPHSNTPEWYATLEAADHLHQPGHRERLLWTLTKCVQVILAAGDDVKTIADWGCGNGGLLSEIARLFPNKHIWGYDILPANIEEAKTRYGFDTAICFKDFVNDPDAKAGNLTILTEVLEHLVEPHTLLSRLYRKPEVQFIVASSPAFETQESHYPHHLWAWSEAGYRQLFESTGWQVIGQQVFAGATILGATR